jgi:hypothetical protein
MYLGVPWHHDHASSSGSRYYLNPRRLSLRIDEGAALRAHEDAKLAMRDACPTYIKLNRVQ